MNTFERRSELPHSAETLYAYHCNPGAFGRLTPPWESVKVREADAGIKEGDVRHLKIGPGPLALPWRAVHKEFVEGRQFVDVQDKGPFRYWRHEHTFEPLGEAQAALRDRIEYEFPLKLPVNFLLKERLEKTFLYRHRQTARDLQLLSNYPGPISDGSDALKVGITGSSGFLGQALTTFLQVAGHQVVALKRGHGPVSSDEALWWPEPDLASLEGLDAVVHLAGEPVAQLWTKSAKESIYFSRVEGTKRLSRALAELANPPKTLISTSAVGYYDQTLDHPVDESAPPGDNFLSTVCRDWEAATQPAENAGIRVCHLRVGLVVSTGGGFLIPQLPAFKTGMGPILGDGKQMQSFIDRDDLIGAIYHLIHRSEISGPVNGTAPHPVSQAEFARELAQDCGTPQWLRIPQAPFKLLLGEQSGILFEGVEALPQRLLETGYQFFAPTLAGCLQHQMSLD